MKPAITSAVLALLVATNHDVNARIEMPRFFPHKMIMDKPEIESTIDLYDDPSVANGEVTKPLTGVLNPHAPQTGVHLYLFSGSFYSHEARLLLHEKGVDYTEHFISIIAGLYDQYNPEYVRMNPRCVVPALVVNGKVTTDAHNMIQYAEDTQLGGPSAPRLIPDDPEEKALVEEYFNLAASVFIETLTYGEWPGAPNIPFYMKLIMKGNHARKFRSLQQHIKQYDGDDPYLKAAYDAKLKILTKMMNVLDSDTNVIIQVVQDTKEILKKLNKQLTEGPATDGKSFLCGENYSKADMQWALVLFRLQKRNIGYLWEDYPAVEAYAQRLIARPQFQKGVVEYQSFSKVVLPVLIGKLKNNQTRIILVMSVVVILLGFFW
jgi:tetrachloro-p-hydroquinone reductive dehalogenase